MKELLPIDSVQGMTPVQLYLDLLQRALINWIYRDNNIGAWRPPEFDTIARVNGHDWPSSAHTMVGFLRLKNIQDCCEQVIKDRVPGDFVETGVWRGGASIFMRGILAAHTEKNRTVWVADSFEGLPPPDEDRYPADKGDTHHTYEELKVSLEEVQENFRRYGLLDLQVQFLKGWFCDTLHKAPIQKISVLRLDGDMYQSTIDALEALYEKVSSGGYIIVDDYKAIPACKKAVEDFRAKNSISAAIIEIDWAGVYWRKN